MITKDSVKKDLTLINRVAALTAFTASAYTFFNLPVTTETAPALLIAAGVGVAARFGSGMASASLTATGIGISYAAIKNTKPSSLAKKWTGNQRSLICGTAILGGVVGSYMAATAAMDVAHDILKPDQQQNIIEETSKAKIAPLDGQKVSLNGKSHKLTFS